MPRMSRFHEIPGQYLTFSLVVLLKKQDKTLTIIGHLLQEDQTQDVYGSISFLMLT